MRREISFPLSLRSGATRLAIAFVLWSAAWVILSDYVVHKLVSQSDFWEIQTEKGLTYVLVSAFLLWLSVRAIERDEAAMRAANDAMLNRLRESGLIGVACISADGTIESANATLALMLGYTNSELVGLDGSQLVAPEYADKRQQLRREFRERGRTDLYELQLVRKDGSRVPIVGGRAKVGDESSIAYFVDISELKKSEKLSKELEEKLLQSEKIHALGRLAGGIAHDFNNELAVIVGYASVLEARLGQDEACRQILRASERSRRLILQLLAFGRKQSLHREIVDVNAIIRELEPMLRQVVRETVKLELRPSSVDEYVEIDRAQFEEAIVNLAINARDAMPQGGVLTISVDHLSNLGDARDLNTDQCVVVKVSDTGVGIEDSIRRHIFEPFFTTKKNTEGTGLGLAMVHGIMSQSGGEVTVASELGRGSTFTLRLPKVRRRIQEHEQVAVQNAPETLRGTVLLVEDKDDLRDMMTQILANRGLRILAAAEGSEAVEIANNTPDRINLILTDILMPRMNGPEAVEQIRHTHPEVKVIYMSGCAGSMVPEDGSVLLPKPVTPDVLLNVIAETLGMQSGYHSTTGPETAD